MGTPVKSLLFAVPPVALTDTVTVPAVLPVRVSVTVAVGTPSAPEYVADENCTVPATSLSVIVNVATATAPTVAPPVGADRVKVAVSSPSKVASSKIGSVSVAVVWPSRKVTVAGTPVKSLPIVAVPPVALTSTVTVPAVPPVRVSVTIAVGTPSAPEYVADENCTVPAKSSSVIVKVVVACAARTAPLVGADSVRTMVSSPSIRVSATIGRVNVAVVWPSANVTVVGTVPKSVTGVAVPPVAATFTVNAPELPPVRVRVTVAVPFSATTNVGAENATSPVGVSDTVNPPDPPTNAALTGPRKVATPVLSSML